MRKNEALNAFTLIELLLVISIIGILSVVALIKYTNVQESARSAEAYAVLADIAASESSWRAENNSYTTTWANLDRYDSAPLSDNFTYTLEAGNFGKAAPKPGKGPNTYYMCFNGTNKGTSAPTCP